MRVPKSKSTELAKTDPQTRRRFLARITGAAAAALTANAISSPSSAVLETRPAAVDNGRAERAYKVRQGAALYQRNLPPAKNSTNADEQLYGNRIGNYSKALPHNVLGEVDPESYKIMLAAVESGDPAKFESIPLGGSVRLSNPQSAYTFNLEGADSHHLGIAAPPALSSAQAAGEMVELYWQALTRDIPFAEYDNDALTLKAAAELTRLSDFHGPKIDGQVTSASLFRGITPGDLMGPYLSQFLWKSVPYGATSIVQRIRTAAPGLDYMTKYSDWLAVQNGIAVGENKFDRTLKYIHSARDLTAFVHVDFTYQAFLNACLILLEMRAPFDRGNPYNSSRNQSGFSTFGGPHLFDLVASVANSGLKAAWYQKWLVHRRLRPEEFGGALHKLRTGVAYYPVHHQVLDSRALESIFGQTGTYLLPQAYSEGCPAHPAYPAGHAVIAGACATVLKAFFDESFIIPNPVKASADGLSLTTHVGRELTLGGELDKLAANMAIGRNAAGVHWRSDAIDGLKLGETVAIGVLTDGGGCLTESFAGFTLTRFDGTTTVI